VGRIGLGVRDSVSFQQKYPPGSVLRCPIRQQKTGVMTKEGVDLSSSPVYNVEVDPTQTLRRSLVQTTDDERRDECLTLAAVSRDFTFCSHFATSTVDNTVDLYIIIFIHQ